MRVYFYSYIARDAEGVEQIGCGTIGVSSLTPVADHSLHALNCITEHHQYASSMLTAFSYIGDQINDKT